MNNNYFISTESGCDLSLSTCEKYGITPLFMKCACDDQVYVDTMLDADTLEFYRMMREEGKLFKTSQVSIGEYYDFFGGMLRTGKPVVHIAIGSGISGSYSNALQAADMLKDEIEGAEIYVVDSLSASAGFGILAIEAANNREKGMSAAECAADINEKRYHSHACYTTDTLTYLAKGGRISPMSASIGNKIGIKPIMKLDPAGHLLVASKAIGRNGALRKIVDFIKNTVENPTEQILYIAHADNIVSAEELAVLLKKEFGFKDVAYSFIGSTIGSHTGPDLQAIFYFGKKRT